MVNIDNDRLLDFRERAHLERLHRIVASVFPGRHNEGGVAWEQHSTVNPNDPDGISPCSRCHRLEDMGGCLVDISENDGASASGRDDTRSDWAPAADNTCEARRPDIGDNGNVTLRADVGKVPHERRLIAFADAEERAKRLSRTLRAIRLN